MRDISGHFNQAMEKTMPQWFSIRAGAGEYTEGYSHTMLSICCGNDITYRTIPNPYIPPIHDKVRELTPGG